MTNTDSAKWFAAIFFTSIIAMGTVIGSPYPVSAAENVNQTKYTKQYVYAVVPLNVRAVPGKSGHVIRIAPQNEKMLINGDAPEGWIHIYGGYVSELYTSDDLPETYTYTTENKDVYTTSGLNIRTEPSTHGKIIKTVSFGIKLHVSAVCNETGWNRTGNGYVSGKYLSENNPAETASPSVSLSAETPESRTSHSGEEGSDIRYVWTANIHPDANDSQKAHDAAQADQDAGNMIGNGFDWYFAAGIESEYGQEIASLVPGDIVEVNDRLAQIDGEVHTTYVNSDGTPHTLNLSELGAPRLMFQTCEPPYHGSIVIKLAHWL